MLTIQYPYILKDLCRLIYGWQPARVVAEDRLILIIKATKEMILFARLNQEIKIYLVPTIAEDGNSIRS